MNPRALAKEIERRYRHYLKTTFYFKDQTLRESFSNALESQYLSRGPFLEATPAFKKGLTVKELFEFLFGGNIDKGLINAIYGDRQLYRHQEEAIKKVFEGKNIIVATGTGSGKTEAFLYPIIFHLYHEFQKGDLCPGVRALILYPMNALANDQRERLGEICKRLKKENSSFKFTFGQYIGETPKDEKDSNRNAQFVLQNRLPGELVLRSEMRENPPHILLTNYSMLEYLLLRPNDSPLFDNGNAKWWRFIVLDEAHQYRGSKGIEMGMLIRRLKYRLKEGGRQGPFTCIATSATLTQKEKDKKGVALFASNLFGEIFEENDVIFGEVLQYYQEKPLYQVDPNDYRLLINAIKNKNDQFDDDFLNFIKKFDLIINEKEDRCFTVGRILKKDKRFLKLIHLINETTLKNKSPYDIKKLSDKIFSDFEEYNRLNYLSDLIELLSLAKDPDSSDSSTPRELLSARYHLFLRSLEGAFISYLPTKKIVLDRSNLNNSVVFEVAVCRNCGQYYIVGKKVKGKLKEAIHDPGDPGFGVTFFRPLETNETIQENKEIKLYNLCVKCGEISRSNLSCNHNAIIQVIEEPSPKDEKRADQIAKCSVCGYHAAGRDPVREVVHGHDGPNVVIATTLYQNLSSDRRKILAFADSRQEAAFFAWYLEKSYNDIVNRNLTLKAIKRLNSFVQEGLTLTELAKELINVYDENRLFLPTMGSIERKRLVWLNIYKEFLTEELRISLEGVGLVNWRVYIPNDFNIPDVLTNAPLNLSRQQALDLICILLDFMRRDRAVEIITEAGVSINWNDLGLQPGQVRVRIGEPKTQKGVRSWDGKTGRRAIFLSKLLRRINKNFDEETSLNESVKILRVIWESLTNFVLNSYNTDVRLLIPIKDAYRLDPLWWRINLIENNHQLFQCDKCGNIQSINIKDVCLQARCDGTVTLINSNSLEENHYRILYQDKLPGLLRVEEHTAQLSSEKAREYQDLFKKGIINVLSSSTTFELGVDLGNLDTVFLRNIPPEAFNYAQRVGRAGRRSGYPGFAISYCRRNPHDLYHFENPIRIIKGEIKPPILTIKNEKIILRHLIAFTLSRFFNNFPERFYDNDGKSKIKQLMKDMSNPCFTEDFKTFLINNKDYFETAFKVLLPDDVYLSLGIKSGDWIEKILDDNSRIKLIELELSDDYKNVLKFKQESADREKFDDAKWAKRRAKTIEEENVLSFLSRKAVIPKYGFPVDVVELDTHKTKIVNSESTSIFLQRELSVAISEFAPTNKIIANKKLWESYGIKKVTEKELPCKFYRKCNRHNFFISWNKGEEAPTLKCCDNVIEGRKYLIPEFGFVTERRKPKEPTGRSERLFSTRPYFPTLQESDSDSIDLGFVKINRTIQKTMVILCEGRRGEGFYICNKCGAGFSKLKNEHKTPFGISCNGKLEKFSLGHELHTDVISFQFSINWFQTAENDFDKILWGTFSLAYALLAGASFVLEVPQNDLNATVGYSSDLNTLPLVVLYDNVPGGAGLVAQLENEDIFFECLKEALKRVNGDCGCDSSCYGCLKSYRNQFAHQYLDRIFVKQYLNESLRGAVIHVSPPLSQNKT
ncbi:MAG: DEAD/DEAH box helicase [Promethearchaeota archaeon]